MRERTSQRYVINVVPRRVRIWPVLPPTSHSSEHKFFVSRKTNIWSNTESFHHAGSKSFDQSICALDKLQQRFNTIGLFQVDRDIFSSALHHVPICVATGRIAHRLHALNAHNLGTHVAEHHRRKRPRPNTGDFNYLVARQRAARRTSHKN